MSTFALGFTAAGALVATGLSQRGDRRLYALAKGLAALGFVWVSLASGALATVSGRLTLTALVASGVGDVFLAWRGRAAVLGGVSAFALAHVLYIASFAQRGIDPQLLVWATGAVMVVSGGVLGWLLAYVHGSMRWVIVTYALLISVMMATGWASSPFSLRALGATALYLSDVAVARDRFVAPGPGNRLWGLPVYYAGQVLLALSAR